jgi:hypothetical protein
MSTAKLVAIIALTVCGLPAFASNPNLVKNPGFELGSTDWIVSSGQFGPAHPHSGTKAFWTDCMYSGCVDTLGAGSYVRQTLVTSPGASYDLSFWVLPTYDASEYSIFWDGVLIDRRRLVGNTTTMILETYAGLTATTSATVLEVHGRNDPFHIAFDDFSVVESAASMTSPVPEPVAGSMLVAGLGALGFMRRRRR